MVYVAFVFTLRIKYEQNLHRDTCKRLLYNMSIDIGNCNSIRQQDCDVSARGFCVSTGAATLQCWQQTLECKASHVCRYNVVLFGLPLAEWLPSPALMIATSGSPIIVGIWFV